MSNLRYTEKMSDERLHRHKYRAIRCDPIVKAQKEEADEREVDDGKTDQKTEHVDWDGDEHIDEHREVATGGHYAQHAEAKKEHDEAEQRPDPSFPRGHQPYVVEMLQIRAHLCQQDNCCKTLREVESSSCDCA